MSGKWKKGEVKRTFVVKVMKLFSSLRHMIEKEKVKITGGHFRRCFQEKEKEVVRVVFFALSVG